MEVAPLVFCEELIRTRVHSEERAGWKISSPETNEIPRRNQRFLPSFASATHTRTGSPLAAYDQLKNISYEKVLERAGSKDLPPCPIFPRLGRRQQKTCQQAFHSPSTCPVPSCYARGRPRNLCTRRNERRRSHLQLPEYGDICFPLLLRKNVL
ncbi:hypothetical protein Mapa_003280 [Marchantia paleacea]|nr:hypothetical protein Mapa_003280 [Marchantia paleacea]